MKYTAEELLDYCEENDMLDGLMTASLYNKWDFAHGPLYGQVYKIDGKYILKYSMPFEDETGEAEIDNISDEEYEFVARKQKRDPDFLSIEICYEGDDHRIFIYFEGSKQEREEAAQMGSLIEFLEYCQIDTRGKLKTAILDGEERFKKWEQLDELIGYKSISIDKISFPNSHTSE